MMRKFFTFLCAALMSVGMFATTVVTITDSDFPAWGDSFTKDGVTVSAVEIDGMYGDISGPGSFSTTLGNFTKIEIFAEDVSTISGEGWSGGGSQKIWTGNASSVSFTGSINGYEEGTTLKFTIEPAATPEPAGEVTVVFAANNKTVERTVTLPHTFWCNLGTENGELDLIIQELYALPLGGYCDAWNGPVATGNPAVTAGAGDEDDDFITISEAFEGTATVSGKYNRYTEMDEEEFYYTLTISIKGDEPEPADEYAEIVWTEVVAKDALAENATFTLDGTTFSATIADEGNKMEIDANTSRFGTAEDYKSYTHRLKSGGASSSTKNFITLNIPEAGKIRIAVRTGSNNATDRALKLEQGGTELYNAVVQESQAIDGQDGKIYPYVIVDVAAGSVRVSYTAGLNFYGFGFKAASTPTAVENAAVETKAIKRIVNGQLLIERDGKLFNVTGAQVK